MKKINIYVLLSAMFHMNKYYDEYVRIVNPKLLLTYTDNAVTFYKIKICGRTSKVAVQNGYRSELVDIFMFLIERIHYPYFETKYFNINELKRLFSNERVSPPFYGDIFTVYAEKK